MDQELKAKWVAALKSGDFKQGKAFLHDPKGETYCCLGVLHRCAGYSDKDIENFAFKDSTKLVGWSGHGEDPIGELAGMNDDGVPFAEIADHIEATL